MTEQQLPEGWQMVKFGDIAKHISKRVEPSETDLEIYVGLEHLDPDSLKIKRHGVPGDVEGQKLLVKKGQIIFGKRRAYQRKVAVADWDCICSAHAMVLEANSKKVHPDFLPYFMQSDSFMSKAVAISEGSLSPTIKWKVLSEQYFPMPNLERQKSIVQVLLAINAASNAALEAQEAVEISFNIFKNKIFSSFPRTLKIKLGEIIDIKNGYAYPGKSIIDEETDNILVTPGNFLLSGGYNNEKNRYSTTGPIRDFKLLPGQLIINMTDLSKAGDTLGMPAILPSSNKIYLHNQRVGLINILNEDKVDKGYLFEFLSSPLCRQYIVATSSGTTVRHTSVKKLLDVEIPLPDLIEQQKIAFICNKYRQCIYYIKTKKNVNRPLINKLVSN